MAEAGVSAATVAAPAGCFQPTSAPKPKAAAAVTPTAPAGPMRVRTDGAALQLGELQQPTLTPEAMVAKVANHLTAERTETARRFVLRFPEVAQEVLFGCDPARAADPTVVFVATVQDSLRGDAAWRTWLQELPGSGRSYAAKRAQAVGQLKAGNPALAAATNLPVFAPHETDKTGP